MEKRDSYKKISFAGLIITLGIVYGNIGTSPLYVMSAIGNGLTNITRETVYGSVSLVFWTLTILTTIKYVIITLRADNKGEGGIFALYALIRRRSAWAYVVALIGGSTFLADGIITPSITVMSAVEGLKVVKTDIPVVSIAIIILSILFFFQQFGTSILGGYFGPVMLVWFVTLSVLGVAQIAISPGILEAVNPVYALKLITTHPKSFFILGAVFLATTGAEALYSDLGHCGLKNIRLTWIFVKASLLLNYFGQAAWMINNPGFAESGINPFFAIMPKWFLISGIIISTIVAVIASQALISGSFTLVTEAMSLNLWPKMRIKHPTEVKGQMYIPNINFFLWFACVGVVLYFKHSLAMEAAYGLSITVTMLMTSILLIIYLRRLVKLPVIVLFAFVYFTIEGLFLVANLTKFASGGWFTLFLGGLFSIIMYTWYNGRKIKNELMEYYAFEKLLKALKKIKKDETIPKFATHLVYITASPRKYEVESTIAYSLLNKQPKRADVYWFLHIDIKDDPYTFGYSVTPLVKNTVLKIDFLLGFRIEPRINLYFHQILEDLKNSGELDSLSRYPSFRDSQVVGDIKYIIIERVLSIDHKFSFKDRLIMNISDMIRVLAISDDKAFNLDVSNTLVEKVPLGNPDISVRIKKT